MKIQGGGYDVITFDASAILDNFLAGNSSFGGLRTDINIANIYTKINNKCNSNEPINMIIKDSKEHRYKIIGYNRFGYRNSYVTSDTCQAIQLYFILYNDKLSTPQLSYLNITFNRITESGVITYNYGIQQNNKYTDAFTNLLS